jgi:hypothetical protein
MAGDVNDLEIASDVPGPVKGLGDRNLLLRLLAVRLVDDDGRSQAIRNRLGARYCRSALSESVSDPARVDDHLGV